MMYESIRGALASDDVQRAAGEKPRFQVRETADWQEHGANLEAEMLRRGMFFEIGPKIRGDYPSRGHHPDFFAVALGSLVPQVLGAPSAWCPKCQ